MSAETTGALGERIAAEYLIRKGYRILETGYRPRYGEIDIIARDGKTTVFVEVKTRTNARYGTPEDAVHAGKIRRLLRAVKQYAVAQGIDDYRIDVVSLELNESDRRAAVRHYRNAVGEEGRNVQSPL